MDCGPGKFVYNDILNSKPVNQEMEESFYRPPEMAREARRIPAETYNLAHVLLKRSGQECVFIPIRSMQYLAVVDAEEIIFVHREGRRMIELAWQHFRPQARAGLSEPVPYEVVYYAHSGLTTMLRLQTELLKALRELDAKHRRRASGQVVGLDTARNKPR
jgi:hypothetical protein